MGQAKSATQLVPGAERRRSQRVLLRVRVLLHSSVPGPNSPIEAFTASVNDHGALLVCTQSFPANARLVLEHRNTRERIDCRVTRTPQEVPAGYHVPIEFTRPVSGFWQIAFPPADWKPMED